MDTGDKMRFGRFIAAAVACIAVSGAFLAALPLEVSAATWSTNVMVNESGAEQHTSPAVAVGPDGLLHFAWTDYRGGSSDPDIYYTRTGDNGTSFLWPNLEASRDTAINFTQGGPTIGVTSNGTALIAWSEFQGQDTNIRAARLGASADSFEQLGIVNKVIEGPQWTPSMSVRGNRAAVVWRDDGSRNEVRVWDASTGAPVLDLKGHAGSVTSVAFSPDGETLASSSEDGLVKLWDAATGTFVGNLTGHSAVVTCVAWSPDGSKLATSSWDYTVKVWDASTRAELDSFVTTRNPVNWVDWSANGSYVAAAYNGVGNYTDSSPGEPNSFFNVTLWNVATGAARTLGTHGNSVTSARYSADGKHIATSSGAASSSNYDNSVNIWNASSGALVRTITIAGGYANSVSWSSAGSLAVAIENGTVALYIDPVANATEMGAVTGHLGPVKAVDWLPGSERLATGGGDAVARVWNSSSSLTIMDADRVGNTIHGVDFSPDGKLVAAGSGNSKIYRRSESHIYCAVSEDGGKTWPAQTRVDSSASYYTGAAASPDVDIAPNGDIGVSWHEGRWGGTAGVYYSNSTDGGATFADDVLIGSGAGSSMVPAVAMDSNGVAHMAWHDSRDKTWTNRFDIYYGSSDAPGVNVRVNATDPNTQQQSADIHVSADGTVVTIAWVEESLRIKAAVSTDGGATFGAPDVVSDTVSGARYTPALAVSGTDVHVAWEDYRRSVCNIFFSTTVLADSWPPHVLGASPAPGATGVSAYEALVVAFSEPVNQMSFASAFQVKAGVETWTGAEMNMTWSSYGDKISMKPAGWHLEYSTTYTATVAATVSDLAGNVMALPFSWTFTTGLDVDGPLIEMVDAPDETSYDAAAAVEAYVVDYTGIESVTLYYKMNGSASIASAAMALNAVQNYEVSIPAQGVLGTLVYYISAEDTIGNVGSLPANLSAGVYLEMDVVDDKMPVITHAPLTSVGFDAIAYVNATVTDGIGLAGVHVEYNTVQSDVVHVANMTHLAGDNYTAAIPAQGDIGTFSYRIVATDSSNNTAATTYNTVSSADGVDPVIGEPLIVQEADRSIVITVSATDNHEISSVTLHFIPVGGKRYIEKAMTPTGTAGTYSTTILEQGQDGSFVYYVNATDASGNVASTLDLNEGEAYSTWVTGKLPQTSVLLGISIAVIVGGIAAILYIMRRRGGRKPKVVGGQPEHPLESVNTPAEGPVGGAGKPSGKAPSSPGGAPPKSG